MTLPSDATDEYWQSEQRDLYSPQSYLFLYFFGYRLERTIPFALKIVFYLRSREINKNDSIFILSVSAGKLISKN